MAKQIRLDKYLCEMNLGTRTQIKEAARKGRIQVGGIIEKKSERKIDPETDVVQFDGRTIGYCEQEYYLLNKPQGVISATEDKKHRTVLDLITDKQRKDLFPVGRLDIDTEGLLLITNDGDLTHRLLSPKKHVDKEYIAHVAGRLAEDSCEQVERGMILLDGTQVAPAKLEFLPTDAEQPMDETRILLTIHEGKFHQVKRMVEALGGEVTYLKRISMGCLRLDETLPCGSYRPLTSIELKQLKEQAGIEYEQNE